MSHEKRMHMIDEQGAGGFALEEGHKLDSSAVEKIQETVDVSEIVAKYDKESVYRSFKGWLDIFIKILCIAFSAFHLYTAATTPFAPQIQRAVHLGFVLTLIYLLYPARATGNMNRLAWYDAILAIAGAVVCGYIVWQYDIIVLDAGPATELDFIMGCASILLVLEAFNIFEAVMIMTSGGLNTSSLMYYVYTLAFTNYRMGYASALAWILFLIILVFTILRFVLKKDESM